MSTVKAGYRLVITLIVFFAVALLMIKLLTPPNHKEETVVSRRVARPPTPKCDCKANDMEKSRAGDQPRLMVNAKIPNPVFTLNSRQVLEPNKFSVIIPTYKRVTLLKRILSNLCNLTSLVDTVIIVWNNLDEPIPHNLLELTCGVRLFFKKEEINSLNNRFKHFPEIRTEAVLSNDDDLLIPAEDLAFQFETWKVFKHLIVGFTQRKHIEFPENSKSYIYGKKFSRNDRRYSIILTTSAMFHVQYLDLYQSSLSKEFRSFIDETMNCEDLFMNAVVGNYLNETIGHSCPGLLIRQENIRRMEKENDSGYAGLWHRQQHKTIRDKCLNMIAKHFRGLPLGYSNIAVKPFRQQ